MDNASQSLLMFEQIHVDLFNAVEILGNKSTQVCLSFVNIKKTPHEAGGVCARLHTVTSVLQAQA